MTTQVGLTVGLGVAILAGSVAIGLLTGPGSSAAGAQGPSARAFIAGHGPVLRAAQTGVEAVGAFVAAYTTADPPGGLAGLQVLAERAAEELGAVRATLAARPGGSLGTAEGRLAGASTALDGAMAVLATPGSTANRALLGSLDRTLVSGFGAWNGASRLIWQLAGTSGPPLV